MPSIGNEVITLVKDTSLVYILGASDILKAARSVSNAYSSFERCSCFKLFFYAGTLSTFML